MAAAVKDDRRVYAEGSPACPVCSTSGSLFFASGRDRLFGVACGEFQLYRCVGCGCVFQNPIPYPSALSTFYPRNYWGTEKLPWPSRFARIAGRLEKAYREFVAMDHVRFLEQCARKEGLSQPSLLDIGCGSGTFLFLARRRGFIPHGMDISPIAVAAARKQYGLQIREGDIASDAWRGHQFDVVTMFHVLEHLTDPKAALRTVTELLKPQGSLIIQVPNVSSLQARFFGTRWYGLDVPRHVINFSLKAMELLLREMGFVGQVFTRFSLRDNPASLASSLIPGLDPVGRRGRARKASPMLEAILQFVYFGLVLLALPPAFFESVCGYGSTIWVHAKRSWRLPRSLDDLRTAV